MLRSRELAPKGSGGLSIRSTLAKLCAAGGVTRVCMEELEGRLLASGNVLVSEVRGNLLVQGDPAGNSIYIVAGENPGELAITGLEGTALNGVFAPLVARVTGSVLVNLGSGDDTVSLRGATVAGNVTLDMGAGSNTVFASGSTLIGGNLRILNRDISRPSTVTMTSTSVSGSLIITGNQAADRLAADTVSVARNLSFRSRGNGSALFTAGSIGGSATFVGTNLDLSFTTVGGGLLASGAVTAANIRLWGVTAQGAVVLSAFSSLNTIALWNSTFQGAASVRAWAGTTQVTLEGGTFGGTFFLGTAAGSDTVDVSRQRPIDFAKTATFQTGAGDDTITLGADQVSTAQFAAGCRFIGGAGSDTLDYLDAHNRFAIRPLITGFESHPSVASARQVLADMSEEISHSLWWLDYPVAGVRPTPRQMFVRAVTARRLYGIQVFQIYDSRQALALLREYAPAMRQENLDLRIILDVGYAIAGTLDAELPAGSTQVFLPGEPDWVRVSPTAPQITFMSDQSESATVTSCVETENGHILTFAQPTMHQQPVGTVVTCWGYVIELLDALAAMGAMDRISGLYAQDDPKTRRFEDSSLVPMNLAPVQTELRRIIRDRGVDAPIIWGLGGNIEAFSSFDYSQDYIFSYVHPVRTWGLYTSGLRQHMAFLASQDAKVIFSVQMGDLGYPDTYAPVIAQDIYDQIVLGAAALQTPDGSAWRPVSVGWFSMNYAQYIPSVSAALVALKGA